MIQLPHLETNITMACQLSCVACNQAMPLWRKRGPITTTVKQVEDDINGLAGFMHADRWGVLGGEPLLHRDIVPILQVGRAACISDGVEVWTNGLMLRRQREDFWRSIDYLVLSIYPGKLSDADVAWIQDACRDHGVGYVPKDERTSPNFRTSLEPTPTGPDETRVKFNSCFFHWYSRSASYGYFFTCCFAPNISLLIQGREFGADGVKIAGATEAEIAAYLGRTEPLGSCTHCAGRETAKPIPWSEEKNPEAWKLRSQGL
jgi:hypothetical protein